MEVIGRVESGTETESNAGAVAEDVLVGKSSCIFDTFAIRGGRIPRVKGRHTGRISVARGQESVATAQDTYKEVDGRKRMEARSLPLGYGFSSGVYKY